MKKDGLIAMPELPEVETVKNVGLLTRINMYIITAA